MLSGMLNKSGANSWSPISSCSLHPSIVRELVLRLVSNPGNKRRRSPIVLFGADRDTFSKSNPSIGRRLISQINMSFPFTELINSLYSMCYLCSGII